MRRGLYIVAAVVLLLSVGLWLAARVERSALTRSHGNKRVPAVVAGRDLTASEAGAPVREEASVATVRCRVDTDGAPGSIVAVGKEVVQGTTFGANLSIALPPGTWSLTWQNGEGRNIPLGAVDAEAGEVYTCNLGGEGWAVSGTVRTDDGATLPGVDVNVCGSLVRAEDDGSFVAMARGSRCKVRAIVRDGLLSRPSEPVTVGPFDARDVALTVDDGPIAGMGLAFKMARDGARVLAVHPDTPAEEAGLEQGDIILSVNGTRAAGLTDDAFTQLGTGREGSKVTLEVEREGERLTVSFYRERLSADTGDG